MNEQLFTINLVVHPTKSLLKGLQTRHRNDQKFSMNFHGALEQHHMRAYEGNEPLATLRKNAQLVAGVALNCVDAFLPLVTDDNCVITLRHFPFTPDQVVLFHTGAKERWPNAKIVVYTNGLRNRDLLATLKESFECVSLSAPAKT